MERVRRWVGVAILVVLVLIMNSPVSVAAQEEARRDLPPNFVAQRLGGPIINFVLPPGGTSGPTSATSSVQSFRFKVQGTITVSGVPGGGAVAFSATGEMQGTDRVHLIITASGTNIPTAQTAELSLIGSDLYFRTLAPPGPTMGLWVKADGTTTGLTAISNPMPNLLDASGIPATSPGLQTLPDEMVNGSLATHLRLTADPSAAGSSLTGTGISMTKATIDAYIGRSDSKLHRLVLTNSGQFDLMMLTTVLGPNANATTPAPTGTAMASLSFAIDFTNFNDATIAILPPASAIPITQLGSNAGGFPAANAATNPPPMPRVLLPPVGMPIIPVIAPKP